MNLHLVLILFQIAVLLFALSFHEAAHGWMASRLGDQTARMLGRVTLNPLRHIDPIGTVVVPALAVLSGWPLIGWAKPTPVTSRNFKHYVRDDILTTLAGPASNLLTAIVAMLLLLLLKTISAQTVLSAVASVQMGVADVGVVNGSPIVFPLALLLYYAVFLDLLLMVFNLLPLPPLDGSHVLRHMLPYNWLRVYDSLGIVSMLLIFFLGGRVIGVFLGPAIALFNHVLFVM
ncbi:MAG: site-2 protease family protein [Acidobacteriaceae bacterium]